MPIPYNIEDANYFFLVQHCVPLSLRNPLPGKKYLRYPAMPDITQSTSRAVRLVLYLYQNCPRIDSAKGRQDDEITFLLSYTVSF